jgi:hypothetical protein
MPHDGVDGCDDYVSRQRLTCPGYQFLANRIIGPPAGERVKRGGAGRRALAGARCFYKKVSRLLISPIDLRDEKPGSALGIVIPAAERNCEHVPGFGSLRPAGRCGHR